MRKEWWLVIIGVCLYLPTLGNGFVWDDEEQIVNNAFIKDWRNLPAVFSGSTFGGGGTSKPTGGYYKPMMSVWYMLNYSLWGDWAGGFHLMQALLHGLNGVLVYALFRILVGRGDADLHLGVGDADLRPLLGALVWLVHPVQVESVAYAASAQEVLYVFFGLLGMLIVIKRKHFKWQEVNLLMVSSVLMLLSLLSKEAAVVLMAMTVAYLWLVEKDRKLAGMYGVLVLGVVGFYGLLRFGVAKVGLTEHEIIPVVRLAAGQRMLTVVETLFQHVRVMVWPVRLYIGHHQVVTAISWEWAVKLLVVLGALLASVLLAKKSNSRVGWFWWLWVITGFGLVSNLYPLDMTFAERWGYGPLIGLIGLLVTILKLKTQSSEFKTKTQNLKLYQCAFTVLVIGLSLRTIVRERDWRDGLKLFSHDAVYAQNAFDVENNLGVELFRVGRSEEAKVHFEKSIELNPDWWTPYSNLGVYYQRAGDGERAAELYKRAIENGDYFLAYENLAVILVKRGDPEVEHWLGEGLARFPNNVNLRNLAVYYNQQVANKKQDE